MLADKQTKMLAEAVMGRVKVLMRSGLSPQKLALTICLGIAAGVFPIFWGTTFLCIAIAAVFRLNHAVIQVVNYFAYPLQVALFLPYCRLGEKILPWGPAASSEIFSSALHGHFVTSISLIGWATLKAASAWLVTTPLLATLLYPLLMHLLRKMYRSHPPMAVR